MKESNLIQTKSYDVEEAIGAQSKAGFKCKLSVAYKEARETRYRIRIFRDSKYLTEKEASSILADIEEILRIIARIQITLRNKGS